MQEKKEYATPVLSTHGQVETLTQGEVVRDCSGPGQFIPFPTS